LELLNYSFLEVCSFFFDEFCLVEHVGVENVPVGDCQGFINAGGSIDGVLFFDFDNIGAEVFLAVESGMKAFVLGRSFLEALIVRQKLAPILVFFALHYPFDAVFVSLVDKFPAFFDLEHADEKFFNKFDFVFQGEPLALDFAYQFVEVGIFLAAEVSHHVLVNPVVGLRKQFVFFTGLPAVVLLPYFSLELHRVQLPKQVLDFVLN
jgi:hypothetical protein